jgi:hypothetical protein
VTDFIITVPADQMTGADFFHALFGSTPRSAEEGRAIEARHQAKLRADILQIRENIARLLSPERAAKAREEWALQDRVEADLRFTMIDLERKVKWA